MMQPGDVPHRIALTDADISAIHAADGQISVLLISSSVLLGVVVFLVSFSRPATELVADLAAASNFACSAPIWLLCLLLLS